MMLKSVSANMERLKTLTGALSSDKAKDLQRALLDINEDLLADIITVLKPFDDATRLVSADKVPTIHLVAPIRLKLLNSVSPGAEDSDPIRQLKHQLMTFLTSHFHINPLHHTALLLDPRRKSIRTLMSAEERMASINTLRVMVSKVEIAGSSTSAGNLK